MKFKTLLTVAACLTSAANIYAGQMSASSTLSSLYYVNGEQVSDKIASETELAYSTSFGSATVTPSIKYDVYDKTGESSKRTMALGVSVPMSGVSMSVGLAKDSYTKSTVKDTDKLLLGVSGKMNTVDLAFDLKYSDKFKGGKKFYNYALSGSAPVGKATAGLAFGHNDYKAASDGTNNTYYTVSVSYPLSKGIDLGISYTGHDKSVDYKDKAAVFLKTSA